MENDDLEDMPLLDAFAEEVAWSSQLNKTGSFLAGPSLIANGEQQQLQMDVFEVMLSLIHGAKTLHEQIVHLHGMAQWLHDEADRFHALGMGTVLMRSSERLH
ncbi:hypothetical protein [Noviherbaspirillum sp. Root189]|uniref:hypothetical protein n=1 Tax=Noviherbaspirillum sp. Root189 TaxID=1736487 RepID=UPI00070BE595|nr:hypothetical protein [Noviherbaspirillum sp. Root189]KRB74253.1 hypothetical protein ASE07_26775 [Noviherbaspirillum sp. Root189]